MIDRVVWRWSLNRFISGTVSVVDLLEEQAGIYIGEDLSERSNYERPFPKALIEA